MKYFLSAAALAATAYTLPTNELVGRSTFELNMVSAGPVFKSGPIHMMKTYSKFASIGAVAPADVQSAAAAAASQQGSVAANNVHERSTGIFSGCCFVIEAFEDRLVGSPILVAVIGFTLSLTCCRLRY